MESETPESSTNAETAMGMNFIGSLGLIEKKPLSFTSAKYAEPRKASTRAYEKALSGV